MKKILGIVLISFLLSNTSNAGKYGTGELQLTESMVRYFIEYIRGGHSKSPSDFYLTTDGTDGTSWYCGYGLNCLEGNASQDIADCERKTGKECKKFAFRRIIKWKNGINPGKGKASKINSKWSDEEIFAKLTELGFYKNDFSKKIEKKKETKKKEPKITKKKKKSQTDDSNDIVQQIKALNKLYKSGVLTKEEFEKAKKKLLN